MRRAKSFFPFLSNSRGSFLPLCSASSQFLWITILFTWTHVGGADGYNLYRGTTTANLVKVATIQGGSNKSVTYELTSGAPQVFGISAYNQFGESTITTTDKDGKTVRFDKPVRPQNFNNVIKE